MNETGCDDVELTISHGLFVTYLVESKISAIKLERLRKKRLKNLFNSLIRCNKQNVVKCQTPPCVQLAVINVDCALVSSINEIFSLNSLDQKTLDKLIQSLETIEFRPLDSFYTKNDEMQRNKYQTEVNVRVENEKVVPNKTVNHHENQTTVICSNVENQRRFPHENLQNLDDPSEVCISTGISMHRRQSLQTFGRREISVLKRSHSWICTSATPTCK